MILQAGGLVITVQRRGHPDTPEYWSDGGFVQLKHTDDEKCRKYTSCYDKAIFDADPASCAAHHVESSKDADRRLTEDETELQAVRNAKQAQQEQEAALAQAGQVAEAGGKIAPV